MAEGKKNGTKLHFKLLTANKRLDLCVGVGGYRTHVARPGGAGYAHLSQLGQDSKHVKSELKWVGSNTAHQTKSMSLME